MHISYHLKRGRNLDDVLNFLHTMSFFMALNAHFRDEVSFEDSLTQQAAASLERLGKNVATSKELGVPMEDAYKFRASWRHTNPMFPTLAPPPSPVKDRQPKRDHTMFSKCRLNRTATDTRAA